MENDSGSNPFDGFSPQEDEGIGDRSPSVYSELDDDVEDLDLGSGVEDPDSGAEEHYEALDDGLHSGNEGEVQGEHPPIVGFPKSISSGAVGSAEPVLIPAGGCPVPPLRSVAVPPSDGRYQLSEANKTFLTETANPTGYTPEIHAARLKETRLADSRYLKTSRLDPQIMMYEQHLKRVSDPKVHVNMLINHLGVTNTGLAMEAVAPLMIMHDMHSNGTLTLDQAMDLGMRSSEMLFQMVRIFDVQRRRNVLQGLGLRSKENETMCETIFPAMDPNVTEQPLLFGPELIQKLFDDTALVLKNCDKLKQFNVAGHMQSRRVGGRRMAPYRRPTNFREGATRRSVGQSAGTSGYVPNQRSDRSRGNSQSRGSSFRGRSSKPSPSGRGGFQRALLGGYVCQSSERAAESVFLLETRSGRGSGRRTSSAVGSHLGVRLSSVQPNWQMFAKSHPGEGLGGVDRTHLANATVVSGSFTPSASHADCASDATGSSVKSAGRLPSASNQQVTKVSGMANLRRSLRAKGFSEQAADLFFSSWAKGTSKQYTSAFSIWVSWCHRRSIDPLQASIVQHDAQRNNWRWNLANVPNAAENFVIPAPLSGKNGSFRSWRHGKESEVGDPHKLDDFNRLHGKIEAEMPGQVKPPLVNSRPPGAGPVFGAAGRVDNSNVAIDDDKPGVNNDDKPKPDDETEENKVAAGKDSDDNNRDVGDPSNEHRLEKIKEMMIHAWDGYKTFAWGANELKPISKTAHSASIFGGGSTGATVIDSLDTLYIMGLTDRFNDARNWVANDFKFSSVSGDFSVFETNIRYVGGLLSAFALTKDEVFKVKAKEVADALLPAFNTQTGIPMALVNLKSKNTKNWSWASSGSSILSEFGSLQLEFEYLSDITGDSVYRNKMQRIRKVLRDIEKPNGFYPNYLNPKTGKWGQRHISMGALGDSFYEYLLKNWLITQKTDVEAKQMYDDTMKAFERELFKTSKSGFMYIAEMKGSRVEHKMDHLACFSAGMFALQAVNEDEPSVRDHWMHVGKELGRTCHESYIRTDTGIGPESFRFTDSIEARAINEREKYYILRPEVIEGFFYLWRTTKDPKYREWAWDAAQAIEKHCRAEAGYSGIRNVYSSNPQKDDVQQSFFLAETLKYLYLTFSSDDVVSLSDWVFNTEAHPLPVRKPVDAVVPPVRQNNQSQNNNAQP